MKFTVSLKKKYQFRHVYNCGKSVANRMLVMYVIQNGTKTNQLGLSVSKKVGKSVIRSRVSRLIKESYRLREQSFKQGFDIIFIARNSCNGASFKEVDSALMHLVKKQNFLKLTE